MRRFVSVWLPQWPIERLSRVSPGAVLADTPLALVEAVQGRLTLTAVNGAAWREGLGPGLALADARAAVPGLATRTAEPAADLRALRRLALWTSRYGVHIVLERPALGDPRKSKGKRPGARSGEVDAGSPRERATKQNSAIGASDGIGIEITGVAHLFGGEGALMADLVRRLSGFGLTVRPGLADTPGAAYALARAIASRRLADRLAPPGGTAARLAPLPVAALRLAPETVTLLGRLGLKTIGDLAALPRQSLERRFNSRDVTAAVLTRLDQALGRIAEPARALVPPQRFMVRQAFAEPLVSSEGVMVALSDLAEGLIADLAKAGAGARRLVLALYRSNGSLVRIPVGLSRPSREAAHIRRLLADKLAAVDLGFGVDLMTLAAPATEPLDAAQTALARAFSDEVAPGSSSKMRQNQEAGVPIRSKRIGARSSLAPAADGGGALLIDRLASRLGPDKVLRLAACASHLPEAAERLVSALTSPSPIAPPPHAPRRGPRPPFLLPHPEPVAVVAEIPDGPPASLEWRRRRCRIVRAEGPERIAPEWWQPLLALARGGDDAAPIKRRPRTRDYYTIEDEAGRRYWVFREGLYGSEEGETPPAWYLHGLFA